MNKTVGIILALIVVFGLFVMGRYNGLVSADEGVKEAWWEVENQYQRRGDLIQNLVNTVRGFADQELAVFTQVTEARASASQTQVDINDVASMASFQQSQGELSSALSRLLVTVEAYPELKSDQNFLELQAQLESTENRISTARNRYNAAVRNLNTMIRSFPTNMIAGMFGFERAATFEADEWAETAPVVDFGDRLGEGDE